MAEDKQTPDKKEEVEEEASQEAPSTPLSDEDVDKLFANISEEAAKAKKETPDNEDDPDKPPADSPPATFDPAMLQTPEGQQAITEAVNRAIEAKSAGAETEAQRTELQKLITEGNYEELGKRWATSMESQQASQTAVDGFLETFYRGLFSDELFQNLTAEERKEIEPDGRFQTDAQYVKHLSKFMANKLKTGASNEDMQEAVNQRIEAMKRDAAGRKARRGSVQGAAPADGGSPAKPTDARGLIAEGLRETFPDAYAQ